ncbi:hypothetical protein ALI144C_46245 [Actinosynnema sp. ALI-1.44]|uniref:hypothetical protein n=1 Tax=Actinosynnema sp. ALI-1.44 TaxID=1933779 RepID=UPI00097C231D|nr:hypothetical protein [Actinosynnema sp. ALI-1.44]ONI73313.1 hypothetical protein ALI144C_46245 [Actinosynnema sp. ALI-1.44]
MGDETHIDPNGLQVGAGLTETASTLKNRLRDVGRPWGDDEPGRSFAKDYLPAAEAVSKAAGEVAAALTRLAENLAAQADAHRKADKPSTQV